MKIILFTIGITFTTASWGADLRPLALYERCHKLLTNSVPERLSSDFLNIKNGRKDPIEACVEMLASAKVGQQGDSLTVDTERGEKVVEVLNTFHQLHASWFNKKEFDRQLYIYRSLLGIQDVYDNTEAALYVTRSLFDQNFTAAEIINSNVYLRSVRSNSEFQLIEKPRQVGDLTYENYVWKSLTPFADQGPLLGMTPASSEMRNIPWLTYRPGDGREMTGTSDLGRHFGAGAIGTQTYLMLNIEEPLREFVVDGALGLARRWGQAVMNDFLCRDLPVVRPGDADPFVVTQPVEATFRNYRACTSCHATMDRMAMTIRNLNYDFRGGVTSQGYLFGSAFIVEKPTREPASTLAWPANGDAKFHERPTSGVLYFRNYQGQLVDISVSDLPSLGQRLSEQNDFYICLAKRYYRYFTGIDVPVGDPINQSLTEREKFHQNFVVRLGEKLAKNQNLFDLLEEILRSPQFRSADFGTDGLKSN